MLMIFYCERTTLQARILTLEFLELLVSAFAFRPRPVRCLRCLLLVICTHPFAKEALTLHLARSEGRERYFGCNLMQRNVLRHLTNT